MTRDPFLRLALIVLVAAFVVALVVVAHRFGVLVALGAGAGGVVGALMLSVEADDGARSMLDQLQARARHARRFQVGPRE